MSVQHEKHHITLTHHPFHKLPKVISGLGQRSQVVQMKRPSMKREGHSREAELTGANKRHDQDEIGSPESIPEREGGMKRWVRGCRVKEWQRLAERNATRQMAPWRGKKRTWIGADVGSVKKKKSRGSLNVLVDLTFCGLIWSNQILQWRWPFTINYSSENVQTPNNKTIYYTFYS